jgi:hypothetical protein
MRPLPSAPRGVADARTARSLLPRAGPGGVPDTYARLTQLARERQRLLAEQDLWQRKLHRIITRLAEIEGQMRQLDRHTRQPATWPPGRQPPRREIEFPY